MKKVGVLSLQGDFAAHGAALERAGAEPVFVREPAQFDALDGLVIPGGESTTMLKLMAYEPGLFDALREFGARKPVFGTCAGAILMADEVTNPAQRELSAHGYRGGAQCLRAPDRQPRDGGRRRAGISSGAPLRGSSKPCSSAPRLFAASAQAPTY